MNQQTVDDFLRVIIAIFSAIAAYQSWRTKKATQSTSRSMSAMSSKMGYSGKCLNAVHCECCPENAQ